MKHRITLAVIVLAWFISCPAAQAKFTLVPVAKDSETEKELGYTITVTENTEHSGLAGTVTIEMSAPKNERLRNLSRIILRTHHEKKLTGRFPLELQKGKSGEVQCHFQLTPELAKGSVLELVCPVPDMPNGVVYQIDLSGYVTAAKR
jgi:hypothetical protein